ncbi:hypothetical protein OG432_24285 [Streptomyces sp. NBC_00442]
MNDSANEPAVDDRTPVYWWCNGCGDEVDGELADCCDDGEIEPGYDD